MAGLAQSFVHAGTGEPLRWLTQLESFPAREDLLQIAHDWPTLKILVRELIAIISQASITTCVLATSADTPDSFLCGLKASSEGFLLLEPRDQPCSSRHIVIENNWRDGMFLTVIRYSCAE